MTNKGTDNTEFELLAADGLRIVSEKENIGPGTTGSLTVSAAGRRLLHRLRAGPRRRGRARRVHRHRLGHRPSRPTGSEKQQIDAAATAYVGYIKDQVGQLVTGTAELPRRIHRRATTRRPRRSTPPPGRTTSASSPSPSRSATSTRRSTSARPTSTRATTGPAGTGSRRTSGSRRAAANGRHAPTTPLTRRRTQRLRRPADDRHEEPLRRGHRHRLHRRHRRISNGAIGLIDEVATGKITGEEEIWSHTDLYDFQANLEGAQVAYEGVRDIVATKDAALVDQIDARVRVARDAARELRQPRHGRPRRTRR